MIVCAFLFAVKVLEPTLARSDKEQVATRPTTIVLLKASNFRFILLIVLSTRERLNQLYVFVAIDPA